MFKKIFFTALVAVGIIAAVHYYQARKQCATPEGRLDKLKEELREAQANNWEHARRIAQAQQNLEKSKVELDVVLAQLANKKGQVAQSEAKLKERIQEIEARALQSKKKILALDADVRNGIEPVTYNGQDFSIATVKEKLVEEFRSYQTDLALLKKLRDGSKSSVSTQSLRLLEQRVAAVEKRRNAYQRQYDALNAEYQQRLLRQERANVRIIELEARLLELRREQADRQHPDAVENDKLAKIEAQIKALENDVAVDEKTITVHDQYHPRTKSSTVEFPQRNLDAEVEKIREHFGTTKEQN